MCSAPERAAVGRLLRRARRRDDVGAERLSHLDHRRAHCPAAAADENRLAGLQAGIIDQPQVGGDSHQRHRRGLFVGNAGRRRVQPLLVDRRQLSERALPAKYALVGAPHAIADAKSCGAASRHFHHACQIAADHKRPRQRHGRRATANVDVDRVDRRGFHLHEHLAIAGRGIGKFADANDFRPTGVLDVSGSHIGPPFRSSVDLLAKIAALRANYQRPVDRSTGPMQASLTIGKLPAYTWEAAATSSHLALSGHFSGDAVRQRIAGRGLATPQFEFSPGRVCGSAGLCARRLAARARRELRADHSSASAVGLRISWRSGRGRRSVGRDLAGDSLALVAKFGRQGTQPA